MKATYLVVIPIILVWIPLSHFLFYGFYQSLTYKEVKKVGVRTSFFHLLYL